MKNIALLLISILVGAITAPAQTLFSQKFSLGLGEPNNAPTMLAAHGDSLLILGGVEKAVFWVNNSIIPTTGLEDLNLDVNQQKSCVYFNHKWWIGIGTVNDGQKYLLNTTGGEASWTSPFAIDSPVNDVFVHDGLLYVVGAFNTVDGQVVNHIFTVDSLNNVTKVGSNGHQQKIVTGLVLNDDLYIIDYVPFAIPAQRTLWKFRNEWSRIDLGFKYQCIGTDMAVDQSGKLLIGGIFYDGNADWYNGLIKYDIALDSVIFVLDDCLGIFYVDSWNNLVFFSGPVSEIEGQPVAVCDLNFLDEQNVNHYYSDNGCIGYLPGIPYLGHYATIESIEGNGLSDLCIVDTVPFTLTGIKDIVTHQAVKVYPNPAVDIVTLEGTSGDISIFNIVGQQINVPSESSGARVNLDIRNLSTGIYTIVVVSKGDRSVARFEKIE